MRTFSRPANGRLTTVDQHEVLSGPRFILYSHDGFGLRHFRRNPVLDVAVATLPAARSGETPEESAGKVMERLEELGYVWGSTAR